MASETERTPGRYARGLLQATGELLGEEALDRVKEHLADAEGLALADSGEFFANPSFSIKEKSDVIRRLAEARKMEEVVAHFLTIVARNGHVRMLPEIRIAFEEALRERRNQVSGELKTAFPLSSTEVAEIRGALSRATGKAVELTVNVDKELIGGVVAQVGSYLYDGSIRGFLDRLKQE